MLCLIAWCVLYCYCVLSACDCCVCWVVCWLCLKLFAFLGLVVFIAVLFVLWLLAKCFLLVELVLIGFGFVLRFVLRRACGFAGLVNLVVCFVCLFL